MGLGLQGYAKMGEALFDSVDSVMFAGRMWGWGCKDMLRWGWLIR